MKFNNVIALGTAGWFPSPVRHTTCLAVIYDNLLVLLDAGSGVSRLRDPSMQRVLAAHDRVCILLSHYHLDHIIGLTFLPSFLQGKRVSIYGPGRECSGHHTVDALRTALSSPFFSLGLDRFPMDLTIHDLVPGSTELSEGVAVRVRCQEHSDPSIGLRLDNPGLAFITDTGCTDETVSFIAGCKTLFHDSFYDADDYKQLSASDTGRELLRDHGHSPGVAEIADRAEVERAYLIHLSPQYSEERIQRMEADARRQCPSVRVPSDLEALTV